MKINLIEIDIERGHTGGEMDENKEYRGLDAIAIRLDRSRDTIRKFLDPAYCKKMGMTILPAVRVGREWWITERAIVTWLEVNLSGIFKHQAAR